MTQKKEVSSHLEREVIVAVATLYLLLCGFVLIVHYLAPQ